MKSKLKIDVVTAQKSHIVELHSKIKQSDVDEVMASSGYTAEQALTVSLENSEKAYTVMVSGKPEMMFGVVVDEFFDDAYVVWMLSSEAVFPLVTVKRFMREAKSFIKSFHKDKLFLWNYVDERNLRSLNWLRKCGFRFVKREERHGHAQIPFIMVLSERR